MGSSYKPAVHQINSILILDLIFAKIKELDYVDSVTWCRALRAFCRDRTAATCSLRNLIM